VTIWTVLAWVPTKQILKQRLGANDFWEEVVPEIQVNLKEGKGGPIEDISKQVTAKEIQSTIPLTEV
jgi:hypothetical protein